MSSYDYKGYVIFEDSEGYYIVDGIEFPSYDEACDWIDDTCDTDDTDFDEPVMRTYHIFYVTTDYTCGYDEFIDAYSPEEAEQKLRKMYHDVAYVADCYPIG